MLTGGTGFVGRQILRGLLEQHLEVTLVLREGQDVPPGIANVLYSSDLFAESVKWWETACRGVETIIHAAWYTVPGEYLHSGRNLDCLAGTLAMAKGAAAAGIRRFAGLGTCFEYDLAYRVLAVETPLRPTTPYAACKAAVFLALSQSLPSVGVSFVWLRLFYLYGQGEDARRLVPYLHQQLARGEVAKLTSGRQIRDFLEVADAGRLIVQAALGEMEGPVNICSGKPMTVRQLAEQIAEEYGRSDLLRFGARPDNAVDPDCVLGIPTQLAPIGPIDDE